MERKFDGEIVYACEANGKMNPDIKRNGFINVSLHEVLNHIYGVYNNTTLRIININIKER